MHFVCILSLKFHPNFLKGYGASYVSMRDPYMKVQGDISIKWAEAKAETNMPSNIFKTNAYYSVTLYV